jgi:AraC-like DNA-binding protein
MDYLVAASPTVGEGMRCLARFFAIISEIVNLEIMEHGGEHRMVLRTAAGGQVPPIYVDYVFAAIVARFRMRIRPGLQVRRVELRQMRPVDPASWEEVFHSPVIFDAAVDCLCFSNEEWQAPIDAADEALARLLEEHARMVAPRVAESPAGFRGEVLKAIIAALPEGASEASVARALHVSVRTLQRKLATEGVTFHEMLDTAKSQLARAYLADPKVSITEIALLLGFSESSSFSRAFRRWTGKSPGRWRRGD